MGEKLYTVVFDIKGVRNELLSEMMKKELIRVYNIYCEKVNSGVTEKLNEEFHRLYPRYFEDNAGKDWWGLTEYNQFMADGYQKQVVDELNRGFASLLLEFYVNPKEVNFMGRLRWDHTATVEFWIKEIES